MEAGKVSGVKDTRLALFLSSLVTGALLLLTLRRGVPMGSDAWLYWQAAVSLRSGDGYVDLWGFAITTWPPGFSLWLAAWQTVLGTSGAALAVAMAGTLALAALGFGTLVRALGRHQAASARAQVLAHGVACALLLLHARGPLAEHLLHVFLPLLVLACWRLHLAKRPRELWSSTMVALGVLLVMLTVRYSAVVFALPLALFATQRAGRVMPQGLARRCTQLLLAAVVLSASIGLVLVLRGTFHQGAGYVLGWGAGRFGPFEYLLQLVKGLDANGGVQVAGGATLVLRALLLSRSGEGKRFGRSAVAFCTLALLGLYLLMNLMRIHDELQGRMTLFATLLLLPMGMLAADRIESRSAFRALVLFALLIPLARAGRTLYLGRGPAVPQYEESSLRDFLPWHAYIAPDHRDAVPSHTESGVLVSPPRFEWMKDR